MANQKKTRVTSLEKNIIKLAADFGFECKRTDSGRTKYFRVLLDMYRNGEKVVEAKTYNDIMLILEGVRISTQPTEESEQHWLEVLGEVNSSEVPEAA